MPEKRKNDFNINNRTMLHSALLKKSIQTLLPNLCSLNSKIVASLVALYLALVLNANDAAAQATFQWTGNIDNNWEVPGNWQLISGTDINNNGYPDDGDNAIFVNLPSTLTTITNAGQTLGTLTLSGSAQVILDLGGNDLITNGAFSVTGTGLIRIQDGNFNPNSVVVSNGTAEILSDFTVNTTTVVSGGTLTLGSGTTTFTGDFTLSGGTFNAGSGSINVQGANFTKSGGTFNGQTATFNFNTNASYNVSSNTDITFYNINYNSSVAGGSITFTGTGGTRTFTIANSLTRSNASGSLSNGINLSNAVLAYSPGASLNYNYTINRNVDPDEWPTTNGPTKVTHSGSQVTLPAGEPRTIPNGGELTLNSISSNFVANSIITIQGTLKRGSATHGITGTAPQYSSSPTDDSQLIYNFSGTATIGIEWPAVNSPRNVSLSGGGTVQTANGSGTVTRTVANNLQILSGTLRGEDATNDILNVNVGGTLETGTLTTQGSFDNGTITLIGTGNQSIVGGGGTSTVSNLTINKGTTTDEVTVVSGILKIKSGGVLRIQQGIFQLGPSTNVLDIIGAKLRIDNGGTFRTGGKTITTGTGTNYELNDGSVFEYNGTGGAETALSIDANDSPTLGPTNSYAILRVSNTINIPTGDVDVRQELQFNTGVNATVNTGGTNGIIRLGFGATITGDNSTTTRFVNGPLRRFFNSSNLTGKFSVGKLSPTAGANDVTVEFQSLSSNLAFTIEQFNQAPTGTVPGGFPTNSRYWRILNPSRSLSGENYRLTVDIAGSNIPTPLNRIVRLTSGSFGNDPTFAAPEGTPQVDDGTTVSNAAGTFPYTSLVGGDTPGFTLAQIGGKVWDGGASTTSWFDDANWDPDGVPSATDDVIIGTPSVQNPTVVVGTGTAVCNTINVGGLAGSPILRIDNVDAIDLDDATPGAQWVAARTTFGATSTVEYLQGNVRSDQYANLTVDGTGTLGTDGGAITVVGNFIKSNTSTFAPTHNISVTGDFTISGGTFNAGAQTYTIGGNFTRSATATFNAGTSTVEFNSSGTQQLTGTTTFYNLTRSNGGTTSLQPSTDVTISNQLNLDNGVLTINANTLTLNGTIIGNGFLSGSSSSNLVIGGTNGNIGTIRFQTGNQFLNDLTMNRGGTNPAATLGTDLSVSGTLTMTSGILNTTATNVLTARSTSGGGLTAYVNGPLIIGQVGTATASYPKRYPVGDGTVYRPFEITTGPNANTLQRVRLVNSSPLSAGATPGIGLSAISAFRYWELTNNTGTAAGTQAGDQVVLGYVLNPVDDGINNLSPYPLRAAARSAPLAGAFSPFGGVDIPSFLGVRGVQSNTSLTTGLRFYTLGSVNASDAPLPVELISFAITAVDEGVKLKWETASEVENAGFIVSRSRFRDGGFEELASYRTHEALVGKGTSATGGKYEWLDKSKLLPGETYYYKLEDVDFNGVIHTVEVKEFTMPKEYSLSQNYPNPFNPSTVIEFNLRLPGRTVLEVYNVLGQRVMTVVDGELSAGSYRYQVNMSGMASGMYLYRLRSRDFVATKKMLLIK